MVEKSAAKLVCLMAELWATLMAEQKVELLDVRWVDLSDQ
jgi:hypothetical protein